MLFRTSGSQDEIRVDPIQDVPKRVDLCCIGINLICQAGCLNAEAEQDARISFGLRTWGRGMRSQ